MPDNEKLRVLRELAGLTQAEAAERFGLHPVTWKKRELRAYPIPPGFITLVRIAFDRRIRRRADAAMGRDREVAIAN